MTGRLRVASATLVALVAMLVFPARAEASFEILAPASTPARGTVVLLHGLNRSSGSMSRMAEALAGAGYRAVNVDYPSAWHDVEVLAAQLDADLRRCCAGELEQGLHFVTHSLGGVLLRLWSAAHPRAVLARSVMLSPPNQGSELVDELKDSAVFRLITGPAGLQLGTDPSSIPSRLGPVAFELGVITGRSSLNPVYSWLIPGEDDGKVSVDRARVTGMKDFLVVDENHTFIMNSAQVIRQTLAFLASGSFDHGAGAGARRAP